MHSRGLLEQESATQTQQASSEMAGTLHACAWLLPRGSNVPTKLGLQCPCTDKLVGTRTCS